MNWRKLLYYEREKGLISTTVKCLWIILNFDGQLSIGHLSNLYVFFSQTKSV